MYVLYKIFDPARRQNRKANRILNDIFHDKLTTPDEIKAEWLKK